MVPIQVCSSHEATRFSYLTSLYRKSSHTNSSRILFFQELTQQLRLRRWDAERLGVIGHSFGGYTVNVLITQTTRFKAAIAVASVSNVISRFLNEPNTGWYEVGQFGYGWTPYGNIRNAILMARQSSIWIRLKPLCF